jgi:parvulin-like peptidyl-prolyl isomerase
MCLILFWHCSRPAQDHGYLIRVGNSTVTVTEFNHAVEAAAEEVFPGEQEVSAASQNDLRMRVLNQLAEELIISERAKALGIRVSDEELARAVADIKSDYPDNTFEKTLLENAVSFQAWKKKLAIRMLVNKVIKSELVDKVEITSQDVAAYFQSHYPQGVPEGENAKEIDQRIVRHLRQKKAEGMYPDWIKNLRKIYPVDVNKKRWNRLVGQKSQ